MTGADPSQGVELPGAPREQRGVGVTFGRTRLNLAESMASADMNAAV